MTMCVTMFVYVSVKELHGTRKVRERQRDRVNRKVREMDGRERVTVLALRPRQCEE